MHSFIHTGVENRDIRNSGKRNDLRPSRSRLRRGESALGAIRSRFTRARGSRDARAGVRSRVFTGVKIPQ